MATEMRSETVATSWTFSIDVKTMEKLIKRAATLKLEKVDGGFSGTMQFNHPENGSTPAQEAWNEKLFPIRDFVYDGREYFSFAVPDAARYFEYHFHADTGAELPIPGTGAVIRPDFRFKFTGSWDGSSEVIARGNAWVADGWLIDCPGTALPEGSPSGGSDDDDSGGGDPPNSTWTSDGG
jgi:hypothetical protein